VEALRGLLAGGGRPQHRRGVDAERGELRESLRTALIAYFGRDILLSPPQEEALEAGIAERSGEDFLISAPTNSGKTLISLFRIFTSALAGERRCVYVVPLKALAEEKVAEFRAIAESLHRVGEKMIKISVTTGDYQLTRDFLGSPPPAQGEIIICTPERLEVMLRNPENHEWARAVDTFVFDEFHILGDSTRGPAMETLLTRLLLLSDWPSMIFLSATIGNPEKVVQWLSHTGRKVRYLHSSYRFPKLVRQVALCESADDALDGLMVEIVEDRSRSVLVFVSTRSEANKLAQRWRDIHAGCEFAAFHAGLGSGERNALMVRIREGAIKGVAATTSLKMGVNFPVTDVIIRDPVLRGKGHTFPLSSSDISQMMGRAGRGEIPGRGIVFSHEEEEACNRKDQLSSGFIDDLRPRLAPKKASWSRRSVAEGFEIRPITGIVLTQFIVHGRAWPEEIEEFLRHTFSAQFGGLDPSEVRSSVDFLARNHLIEPVDGMEGAFQARPLGRTIALCGLSPESGCILAGMIRALIKLQKNAKEAGRGSEDLIARLTPLDFLFLAVSAHECRDYWLKKSDHDAVGAVQEYIEKLPLDQKPLFNRWRKEKCDKNPSGRLLATLKVEFDIKVDGDAEEIFGRMMATAILLHRHAKGESLLSLSASYSHSRRQIHEGDLESGLKFTATWMLSCLAQICDPDKAYDMGRTQLKILDLLEDVSLGSEMGKLTNLAGIGAQSVKKLISSGITDIKTLHGCSDDALMSAGLTRKQTKTIKNWLGRRIR